MITAVQVNKIRGRANSVTTEFQNIDIRQTIGEVQPDHQQVIVIASYVMKTGAQAHLSKTDRERVKARVAELDRQGWSQAKIAEQIGKTQPMVCIYLKHIRQEYKRTQIKNRKVLIATKVQQLNDVMKEAWQSWYLSKQDFVKRGKKKRANGQIEQTIVKELRTGASEYLSVVLNCLKEQIDLLGIKPDKTKTGDNFNFTNISWDQLFGRDESVGNRIEQRLNKEMGVNLLPGRTDVDVQSPIEVSDVEVNDVSMFEIPVKRIKVK